MSINRSSQAKRFFILQKFEPGKIVATTTAVALSCVMAKPVFALSVNFGGIHVSDKGVTINPPSVGSILAPVTIEAPGVPEVTPATPATAPLAVVAAIQEEKAKVEAQVKADIGKEVVKPVLGDEANKTYQDLSGITNVQPELEAAVTASTAEAVKTGDLTVLNPVAIAVQTEIRRVRDQYWSQGEPLPGDVMALIPDGLKGAAGKARFILVKNIGSINLPHEATRERNAIVLDDLIFVTAVMPHPTQQENAYFWTHEVYHVKQYSDLGTAKFAARYTGEETGFHGAGSDGVNAIEREADLYACQYYPVSTGIAYIQECGAMGPAGQVAKADTKE